MGSNFYKREYIAGLTLLYSLYSFWLALSYSNCTTIPITNVENEKKAENLSESLQIMRPHLLCIARLQLRDEVLAEDVVSETIVVTLENESEFKGASQLKTWVVGILKHKIIDCLREQQKYGKLFTTADDDEDIETYIFKQDGHFAEMPADWNHPEHALEQTQFFDILEICMTALPPIQGRVFLMKEWFEFSANEIGQHLAISTSNVNVMLHRARLRLRDCLQIKWFGVHL